MHWIFKDYNYKDSFLSKAMNCRFIMLKVATANNSVLHVHDNNNNNRGKITQAVQSIVGQNMNIFQKDVKKGNCISTEKGFYY